MNERIVQLGEAAGLEWFDYQVEALEAAAADTSAQPRHLLFYKTGAGKSYTALGMLALMGQKSAVVITPPATFGQWIAAAEQFKIDIAPMSHARFRMKETKLSRTTAVIADEYHLFGGHTGKGYMKLDTLSRHLDAPLIGASATPNYNDAERCYCILHVLDRHAAKGGYLEFLYKHCLTEQDPFSINPKVLGFQKFKDAAGFLASLPNVHYLKDDAVYKIVDIPIPEVWPAEAETFGLNRRAGRIIASQIEEKHARVNLSLIDDYGLLRSNVYDVVDDLVRAAKTPSLVFAAHSTVADALGAALTKRKVKHAVITGGTSAKFKDYHLEQFRGGHINILVGTASLATGTDGLDRVCNTLVILDDTDDPSLRRQLVGRILPRGASTKASPSIYRLELR